MKRLVSLMLLLSLTLFLLPGCADYQGEQTRAFSRPEEKWLFAIVFETSPEFQTAMFQNRAYEYCLKCVGQFAQDRVGSDDTLFLIGMPMDKKSPLWEGRLREFKQQFPDEAKFKSFVSTNAAPRARLSMYESLADTLDYLTDIPGVRQGNTRLAVLVLSHMNDDAKRPVESRKKLVAALKGLHGCNAELQMAWLDRTVLRQLKEIGREAGMDWHFRYSQPDVPTFQDE